MIAMKIEEIIEMEKKRYFENCKQFYIAKYEIDKLKELIGEFQYKKDYSKTEESSYNFWKGAAGESLYILKRLETPEKETNNINTKARLSAFAQIWEGN